MSSHDIYDTFRVGDNDHPDQQRPPHHFRNLYNGMKDITKYTSMMKEIKRREETIGVVDNGQHTWTDDSMRPTLVAQDHPMCYEGGRERELPYCPSLRLPPFFPVARDKSCAAQRERKRGLLNMTLGTPSMLIAIGIKFIQSVNSFQCALLCNVWIIVINCEG